MIGIIRRLSAFCKSPSTGRERGKARRENIQTEQKMNRRILIALITALGVLSVSGGAAQQAPDIEGVKAASKAFYDALPVLDDGTVMEKVWAGTPYVTYIGPRNTSIIVGWAAQKKYWESFNKGFAWRNVALVDVHRHVNGNLAWEIGLETGQAQLKDGAMRKVDWFVTNVYEKLDGRWLMVSHHVQPKPQ
jgi:ketosteroid isomerase-like protein